MGSFLTFQMLSILVKIFRKFCWND